MKIHKALNPKRIIELIIFNVRWLLIPFYLKLVFTLGRLLYLFYVESELSSHDLIITLESLDIVMIANLVKMIITGSYNSFVAKDHGYHGENISSGSLKIKIGTSLIGLSSIHLLQVFVNSEHMTMEEITKKILIHLAFIVGGALLAIINKIHVKSEEIEVDTEIKEHNFENKKHEKHEKTTHHSVSSNNGTSQLLHG